jgi:hypothetical protein
LIVGDGAGFIVTVAASVPVMLLESVTVTVKLEFPALVGVPESAPAELRVRPAGRELAVVLHVYGGVPPVAAKVRL